MVFNADNGKQFITPNKSPDLTGRRVVYIIQFTSRTPFTEML